MKQLTNQERLKNYARERMIYYFIKDREFLQMNDGMLLQEKNFDGNF